MCTFVKQLLYVQNSAIESIIFIAIASKIKWAWSENSTKTHSKTNPRHPEEEPQNISSINTSDTTM